tara:strand:- start:660 stop:1016 length:357 start_codon:yes stop_codon:yes gene_type:complete
MFRANSNKGFFMAFDNGFGISVQWGTMNYCSSKDTSRVFEEKEMQGNSKGFRNAWESTTAEIAVFKGGVGKCNIMMSVGDNDQVIGWLTTDDVAQVIEIVSKYKTEITIMKKIIKLNL